MIKMPNDDRWNKLSPSDWDAFAKAWIAELRQPPSDGKPSGDDQRVGQSVVQMNFTATAECQWKFILAAVKHAESDDELGHVAAGPVEHLLSTHGQEYIGLVEQQAATVPKFGRMMKGVWRQGMSDDVWSRVCEVQCRMGIYYNRGFNCLDRGDIDNALADFTESIRLDPQQVESYGGRALAYQKKGEFAKAIADVSECIRLKPEVGKAYYLRGLVYQQIGEESKADADFAQAKKLGYKPKSARP
jgi:tetratricopeptide (TPR) repeat protein